MDRSDGKIKSHKVGLDFAGVGEKLPRNTPNPSVTMGTEPVCLRCFT